MQRSKSNPFGGNGSSGQAMIEFAVALFAVVAIVAAITDFTVIAEKRGDLYFAARGKAGLKALAASSDAAQVPQNAEDALIPSSYGALLADFQGEDVSLKMPLSKIMREWVFGSDKKELVFSSGVWLPPLSIGTDP